MTTRRFLVALFAFAATAASAQELRLESAFRLNIALQEASGLAPASASSVFAHNDEYAIIYEIDIDTGDTLRAFALGAPTAKGDFEGVALAGGSVWLVASDGRLIEGRAAEHGKRSRFNVFDAGVPDDCEVEGVAPADAAGALLLVCKQSAGKDGKPRLKMLEWSSRERWTKARLFLDRPLADFVPDGARKDFKASDLARDPKTGDLFILNSSGGLLELGADGALRRYDPLDRRRHPQPEGLALFGDGRIAIADEGAKREGTLSIYRRN